MAGMPGILIKIGADTRDAVQGLNRIDKALGRSRSRTEKFSTTLRKVGPALAAGTAAFVAVAAQAVDAAMTDESELSRLNTTLGNLGFGAATDQVSAFIDNLQYAANVSESELRPAFALLLSGSKDLAKAQSDLNLVLDIAASTGMGVEEVAGKIAGAYAGNRKGLVSLKSGIDKTTLSQASMADVTRMLADRYGGSGAAQAGTLKSSVAGVKIAFDELNESFGSGILTGAGGGSENLAGVEDNLRGMQTSVEMLGKTVGTFATGAVTAFDVVRGTVTTMVYNAVQNANVLYDAWIEVADKLGIISDAEADRERANQAAAEAAQQTAYYEDLLGTQFATTGTAAQDSVPGLDAHAAALLGVAGAADTAAAALMSVEELAAASTWSSGPVTTRNQANEAHRRAQARARAARLAAKKKRVEERRDAVRIAKAAEAARKRAQARTGTNYGAVQTRDKRSCA